MSERPAWPAELAEARRGLDAIFRANPYAAAHEIELEAWGPGWAVTASVPSPASANIAGTVHGGIITGLADVAFEVACNSYGRQCVALALSGHFAAAAPLGARLTATAEEVTRSRRVASYRLTVTTAEKPVAWYQATAYCTAGWHLGEDAYPAAWRAAH